MNNPAWEKPAAHYISVTAQILHSILLGRNCILLILALERQLKDQILAIQVH